MVILVDTRVTSYIALAAMSCYFSMQTIWHKEAGWHLIKVCLVSNDVMILLLDGLQMCNNGISQVALELAPSHVPHLLQKSILQAQ